MEIRLINLLSKGEFGSLKLGDELTTVMNVLGEPNKISSENTIGKIFNYKSLEIIFGDNKVASIEVVLHNFKCSSKLTVIDLNKFNNINFSDFNFILQDLSISNYRMGKLIGEERLVFLPNKVQVGFIKGIISSISVVDPEKIYS